MVRYWIMNSKRRMANMHASERQEYIVSLVEARGTIRTEQLLDELKVSKMTLWRDLKALQGAGKIGKTHGAAVSNRKLHSAEPPFDTKSVVNVSVKQAIARHAAQFYLEPSQSVIFEGGTTVAQMVQYIDRSDCTILTHGLNTLMMAARLKPNLVVMSCGGTLRHPSWTFVGPEAEEFFGRFQVDTFFLGGTGITAENGITDVNTLEIKVKRAMYNSAARVIGLFDSSKFGQRSLARLLHTEELDVLVTDEQAPSEIVQAIRDKGVRVDIVETGEEAR